MIGIKRPVIVWFAGILLILVILCGAHGYIRDQIYPKQESRWVAVSLDTGLIYFGQLKGDRGQYLYLEKSYYAKENPAYQPSQDSTESQAPRYLLTKVEDGDVYQPDDVLQINRDHVLAIQNLKSDSEVLKTVTEGK